MMLLRTAALCFCALAPAACLLFGRGNSSKHIAAGNLSNCNVSSRAHNANASKPAPSMFVAVFTTRDLPKGHRDIIRRMWSEVDHGSGMICFRFIVCRRGAKNEGNSSTVTTWETDARNDLLVFDCEEGYTKGLLTQKLAMVMQAYVHNKLGGCEGRSMFMKIDDDTFVSGHRLRNGLGSVSMEEAKFVYAGMPLKSNQVVRNPRSPWYEPEAVYPLDDYMMSMSGGTGYVLGGELVRQMLSSHIVNQHMLWNEDRAVGLWVRLLEYRGLEVQTFKIPGTNGYLHDNPTMTGTWGEYPYVLHHHITKETIDCLIDLDWKDQPTSRVEPCFVLTPVKMLGAPRAPALTKLPI